MPNRKTISKDPSELSVHPAAKIMAEWAKDDLRFIALVEDIRQSGIYQPLLIDDEGRIVDGRHRWRAAKQLQLEEVECKIVSAQEISSIILNSLLQRRHYSKGALAYLAFPLLEPAHKEAQHRKLEMLRKGSNSPSSIQSTTGKTVEDFARGLGFGRDLFYQARDIHAAFSKTPSLRKDFEEKILAGDIGLGACLAGIAGQAATSGKAKRIGEQLELFQDAFDVLSKRFTYWQKFDPKQKAELLPVIRKTIEEMPSDLRAELVKALKDTAKKEEGK